MNRTHSIEPVDARVFRLPPALQRPGLLADELRAEHHDLMHELAQLSDRLVGRVQGEVFEQLWGDPSVVGLARRFTRWLDAFAQVRLRKRNPRDKDARGNPCEVVRFQRIFGELGPWLDELSRAGANAIVADVACQAFLYRLCRSTWGRHVRFVRTWESITPVWDGVLDSQRKAYCQGLIDELGWNTWDDLDYLCSQVAGDAPADDDRASLERPKLAALASRIATMRPSRLDDFAPARTITELPTVAGIACCAWEWTARERLDHQLGWVWLGKTREQVIHALSTRRAGLCVAIGPDGTMGLARIPSVSIEKGGLPGAWQLNGAILEHMHDTLAALGSERDPGAMTSRDPTRPGTPAEDVAPV